MSSHEFLSSGPEGSMPRWHAEYEAALQETDHKTLFKRVEVAEATILTRREALLHSADGFLEQQEIKMALDKLRQMKKEVLKFS